MLLIRDEQMRAFQAAAEDAFAHRVAEDLRQKHAERVDALDDELLLEMVTNGIRRGRRHGLTWESSLTKFVALMFAVGPDFDRHPKAASVLANPEILADDRVDALVYLLSDAEWEAARAASHPYAWFEE